MKPVQIPLIPKRPWCKWCNRWADVNYCGRKVCNTRRK